MELTCIKKIDGLPDVDRRVIVKNPHPHGGKTGIVTNYIKTIIGIGSVVRFDDSLNGTVFKSAKWEYV